MAKVHAHSPGFVSATILCLLEEECTAKALLQRCGIAHPILMEIATSSVSSMEDGQIGQLAQSVTASVRQPRQEHAQVLLLLTQRYYYLYIATPTYNSVELKGLETLMVPGICYH